MLGRFERAGEYFTKFSKILLSRSKSFSYTIMGDFLVIPEFTVI